MQLALRRAYGYAFAPPLNRWGMQGLGQSGEVPTEIATLPAGTIVNEDPVVTPTPIVTPIDPLLTDESGVNCLASMFVNGQCPSNDPTAIYANPGYNITTTPGVVLSPAELAVEQSRATAWLAQIPGALSTAGKIAALTSAQIAAGIQSGALKPSSTCPSGYLVAGSAQCVPAASSGLSNPTLAIVAVLLFGFMMMSKK
jgi:hypothetical protein